jgi:nucleoside 2-deoxyribosyltransferase
MLIYLSGGIEYAPDKGRGWRAVLTPFLRSLGHEVYDPAEDVRKNLEEEEARQFRQWKRTEPERFRATLRKIIAWDLDWIEYRCDCVVALWDEYAQRGAGSASELTLAHRRGIPVYLVAGMSVEEISGWILGCATEIFPDVEHLQRFFLSQAMPAVRH